MKLNEAIEKGYTREGRHNELVREALRDHWSEIGPKLLEALKRFLESSPCENGCDAEDMTCDTSFARRVIAEAEEVKGI